MTFLMYCQYVYFRIGNAMKKSPFTNEFQLDVDNASALQHHLHATGRLLPNEQVEKLEVAGKGNMNMVLRATTSLRSLILKQSNPWVQKYPSVAAPIARINTEAAFYKVIRENETLRQFTPEIYWLDEQNHLLCMEDLGVSGDFSSIYAKGASLTKQEMVSIIKVVSELHRSFNENTGSIVFDNKEMRALNHQHIFQIPLQKDNGLELDYVISGLQSATDSFRKDQTLKSVSAELGDIYLNQTGTKLLHGDFYPGSWLKTESGLKMIDPEFCFMGPAEFELGVTVAHLKMAQQPDSIIKDLFVYYDFDTNFDRTLFSKFAGMEVIRRIIGLAQLPLELNLKERLDLLDEAYELMVN